MRKLVSMLTMLIAILAVSPVESGQATTSLPRATLVKPSVGVLGAVNATSLATGWAKYYAPGLIFTQGYVQAGTQFTLKWKVTGTNGKPLPDYPVTLQANKAWGGNTATFATNCIDVNNTDNSVDGADVYSNTDSAGMVSFTITNMDSVAEPKTTSVAKIDQNKNPVYGQFSLQIGALSDLQQAKEIVELHILGNATQVVKPTCTNWQAPASEYAKSTPLTTSASNISKPTIAGHTIGNLVWSDEFNGKASTAPEANLWTSRSCGTPNRNGGGIYCAGGQYYVPTANQLDGQGHLAIATNRVTSPLASYGDCQAVSCPFSSGRFDSQGKLAIQYGYLEARIQLPAGNGQNPAFWLLGDNITRVGWPTSGEIDVMEQPLIQLNQNAGSLHYSTTGGGCCSNHQTFTKLFTNTDQLSSAFHTFGILWQPNLITFYFDGQPYGQLDKNSTSTNFWPFNAPEFLIFDNSTPGDPVTMNWQSSTMVVDYVRLWKADGLGSAWTH